MFSKSQVILFSVLTVFTLLLIVSCSKNKSTAPTSVPVVTTAAVSAVTQTTAQCGGTVTSDGGANVFYRGVCWRTDSLPTYSDSKTYDGTGTGTFTSSITGLAATTHYYIRAYAMNDIGLGYGSVDSFFTTDSMGTVTDVDNNTYRTIKIGNQWWMAENLKVRHYRNNDSIPNVTDSTAWDGLTSGAYCNFNNNVANVAIYGRLYNWYAVNDSRVLAPTGWHVARDDEWQTLVNYVGGDSIAGGKLKETGTSHWITPNAGATNEYGFCALPGGFRYVDFYFYGLGAHGNFWTSTAGGGNTAWYRFAHCTNTEVAHFSAGMTAGFAVRCVRD
jgi:uncharacterized protein (TIGR02145 family)